MNFSESVSTGFKKYADFNGCATRSEFWWLMLFIVVVSAALNQASGFVGLVFSLATLIPSLSAGARRLHDTDRSGWWQLLNLVPFVGWIIVIVFFAQEGTSNRYSVETEAVPS